MHRAAYTPTHGQHASLPCTVLPHHHSGRRPATENTTDAQRSKLAAAEEAFQQSDTLRALKERSEANRAKNKKAIENKWARARFLFALFVCV